MRKVIHNIRNRPDHHIDRIIWISIAVAIGLLLIIWMIVGNGRKTAPDSSLFQSFGKNVETGKNTFPADPSAP